MSIIQLLANHYTVIMMDIYPNGETNCLNKRYPGGWIEYMGRICTIDK